METPDDKDEDLEIDDEATPLTSDPVMTVEDLD